MSSRLAIILSAVFFNLAFFFPCTLGFLILFSFMFLLLGTRPMSMYWMKMYGFIKTGFLWGSLVYLPHLVWLYILLLTKSKASFFLATELYLLVVSYFVLLTIIFFVGFGTMAGLGDLFFAKSVCFARGLANFLTFITVIFSYFYFIQNFSLWVLGRVEGYPFINPLIPLICFFSSFNAPIENHFEYKVGAEKYVIYYLKPIDYWQQGQGKGAHYYSQKIYQKLAQLDLYNKNTKTKKIVLAPESFFPFSLNEHQDRLNFWYSVLPKNTYFLFGSLRSHGRKNYQTVYLTHEGLIKSFYDKTHLIPFVEKFSKKYNKIAWMKSLFLGESLQFNRSKKNEFYGFDRIINQTIIVPKICSEFFFNFDSIGTQSKNNKMIILFVNDSWFCPYFRKLMHGAVKLRSLQAKSPIIYVGHESFFVI